MYSTCLLSAPHILPIVHSLARNGPISKKLSTLTPHFRALATVSILRLQAWEGAGACRHRRCSDVGPFSTTSSTRFIRSTMSEVRQNFHEDCEKAINRQINMELSASYTYLSMAYYMHRHDVALPGLFEYFKKASDEEREHAMKFMEYQNRRGGRIELTDVAAPGKSDWGGAKGAMEAALELEKEVNESLLALHGTASGNVDPHLCDFLETEFLDEQVSSIKELADHVTNLNLVGDGLGVYMFDKHFDKK